MAAAAAGEPAKAISLFDEAAILAPLDPTVMRRLHLLYLVSEAAARAIVTTYLQTWIKPG